jgi:hypothetical protein
MYSEQGQIALQVSVFDFEWHFLPTLPKSMECPCTLLDDPTRNLSIVNLGKVQLERAWRSGNPGRKAGADARASGFDTTLSVHGRMEANYLA